ncbi:MAG TPA: hypothetical protein VEY30_13320, partial [Myxococcaceae bacterium]|nr:hypothetical protein [Myxococcaceae bacterium]
SFFAQDSNSYGEALSQHRLSAALGIRLPASMSLLAQAAVQLSRYPQGVSLSVQERLRVDDESLNALSLKWVAPLSDHWDFELRYALLYNRLPRNELTYVRQYGWGGLVFRL